MKPADLEREGAGVGRPVRFVLVGRIGAWAVLAWVLAVLVEFGVERGWLWAFRDQVSWEDAGHSGTPDPDPWTQVDYPGVDRPEMVTADEARLEDDEEVLGVEVNGQARAYRLKALANPVYHVVNDEIGGQPVSVSYCDLTRCVHAFTSSSGSDSDGPLDLGVGGLWHGGMVLRVGTECYEHKTGRRLERVSKNSETARTVGEESAWPLASVPLTRTTWKEWKARHPETDVYEHPSRPRKPEK